MWQWASVAVNFSVILRWQKACREVFMRRWVQRTVYPLYILFSINWMSKGLKISGREASLSFSLELERNQGGGNHLSVAISGPWALIGSSLYRFPKISHKSTCSTNNSFFFYLQFLVYAINKANSRKILPSVNICCHWLETTQNQAIFYLAQC